MTQIDKDREANVTDAAIHTIGALAMQLPWVQYEQLLNQWLKIMKKSGTKVDPCSFGMLPSLISPSLHAMVCQKAEIGLQATQRHT